MASSIAYIKPLRRHDNLMAYKPNTITFDGYKFVLQVLQIGILVLILQIEAMRPEQQEQCQTKC